MWDRATQTAFVLVWDERAERSFSVEIRDGDSSYDVFHHPFAYAALRDAATQSLSRQFPVRR